MTTISRLDKLANEWFTPHMARHGFRKLKKGFYLRDERWPLHDVVFWDILSSGESLRVYVTCWTPAGYSSEELKTFPDCVGVILGGPITDSGMDRGVWGLGNDDDLDRAVLRRLYESIQLHAFPWFKGIRTADDYLEKLKWMRGLDREVRERIKAELPALFEKSEKGSE